MVLSSAGEDRPEGRALRRVLLPGEVALEHLGLGHVLADVQHQEGRQHADPEQAAPGPLRRQQREGQRVQDRRRAPAHRPAALHRAHGLAAMLGADDLAHQHRADGPLAAEAQALQRAQHEQLFEVLREADGHRADREPQDGVLQHAHAAVAVGQDAREPAAQRREQQRDGAQHAGLPLVDAPKLMSVEITKVKTMKSSASTAQPPKAPTNATLGDAELFVPLHAYASLMLQGKCARGCRRGADE